MKYDTSNSHPICLQKEHLFKKNSTVNWNYLNMYLSFGWAKLRMSAFLCACIYLESETGGPSHAVQVIGLH